MDRRAALAAIVGGALTACRRTAGPLRTLTVASAPHFSVAPLYLADERGYFADAGLRVETQVLADTTQAIPLLAAGRVDVAFAAAMPPAFNAIAKGARIAIVAARDVAVAGCTHEIHGRRASFPNGFEQAGELQGKRVAVTAASSLTAFVLDALLDSAGLNVADVQRVVLRQTESTAALLAGQLDASVDMDRNFSSPDIIPGPSLAHLMPGFQYSYIQFGRTLLDGDVAVGSSFLAAYFRGVREFRAGATPRDLRRIAADGGMSPVAVQTACRERIPEDGRIDRPTVRRMIDWAVGHGFAQASLDASQVIDMRYLDRVDARNRRST